MSEEIRQIAERLVGLERCLRPSTQRCRIDLQHRFGNLFRLRVGRKRHSGQFSAPDSQALRRRIAGIDVRIRTPNELLFPYPQRQRCQPYERTKAYKYQSLAAGFANRKADPFMVTVEPYGSRSAIHAQHPPRTRI